MHAATIFMPQDRWNTMVDTHWRAALLLTDTWTLLTAVIPVTAVSNGLSGGSRLLAGPVTAVSDGLCDAPSPVTAVLNSRTSRVKWPQLGRIKD